MTRFEKILHQLHAHRVEFILIGGMAARVWGSSRLTDDIDIVYRRTLQNMERLIAALAPYQPYLRGAPPGLPFQWEVDTLRRGLNFKLITQLGSIDLFGEVAGGGTYEQLLPFTVELKVGDIPFRCVNLSKLIELKRAAGRPRDLEAIAELEMLSELQESGEGREDG
jgi:predicted nucleotidyltransferase